MHKIDTLESTALPDALPFAIENYCKSLSLCRLDILDNRKIIITKMSSVHKKTLHIDFSKLSLNNVNEERNANVIRVRVWSMEQAFNTYSIYTNSKNAFSHTHSPTKFNSSINFLFIIEKPKNEKERAKIKSAQQKNCVQRATSVEKKTKTPTKQSHTQWQNMLYETIFLCAIHGRRKDTHWEKYKEKGREKLYAVNRYFEKQGNYYIIVSCFVKKNIEFQHFLVLYCFSYVTSTFSLILIHYVCCFRRNN